ncbi:zinc dependent phospholipase C family protein [Erysipelothrix inopinata]|uniref:Zinc dependent phospholipase C family protein n=1 Tax=Erysipelothrix inopinata TaxID=225084 RepID=A0A7G9RWS5_9FIRM|nr:zinc dependent phospholipase C family protein [Erysipelothrix inopinata]
MAVIPNVITHGLMALDVYNKLEESDVQKAIKNHPRAYLLGSNGPDLFFYYNVLPWQDQNKNRIVTGYGETVHTRHINDFYNTAAKTIVENKDERRREILTAYLAGHFMHWSLDSLGHPFIFYRGGEIAGETQYWHFRYESMLDSLMVLYVKQRRLEDINIEKFVDVDDEERRVISTFYQSILKTVFDIHISTSVVDSCIRSFKTTLRFLFDPHNIKTPIIRMYENYKGKPWAYTSHVVNSNIDAEYDVLNLKKEAWCNPTNLEDVSHLSFIEIYDQSVEQGVVLIESLNSFLKGETVSFDPLLQNRQYDTGRPVGDVMKYYGSIYEHNKEAI